MNFSQHSHFLVVVTVHLVCCSWLSDTPLAEWSTIVTPALALVNRVLPQVVHLRRTCMTKLSWLYVSETKQIVVNAACMVSDALQVAGVVLAAVAGIALGVQAGTNSTLGKFVGKGFAGIVSFASGLLCIAVFFVVSTYGAKAQGPTASGFRGTGDNIDRVTFT